MFERSAQQRSCQLVTIVGEPGVGKSRLCGELFGHIEDRSGLVRWRQGRSLPYGEGIAFWALGEIVKAECGILESDSPDEAEAKLVAALPSDDPDLAWLEARLAPLVSVGGDPVSQEESFTAWRRFLEHLATGRETVLVFQDLHWADTTLLSFLEHLADWAEGVPLLVLCTARPELYEEFPHFGAEARNAQRINLEPLSDLETARLLASLPTGPSCLPRRSRPCSSAPAAIPCTRRSSLASWQTRICCRERSRTFLSPTRYRPLSPRASTRFPTRASYSSRTPLSWAASSGPARSSRWARAGRGR